MQSNMKRKYETPKCKTIELKFSHRLLAGSNQEKDPEPFPSGEGTPDD